MIDKRDVSDLAAFGGPVRFVPPVSTSNLVRPDFETFLRYSETFYAAHRYSNTGPLSVELERRLALFHDVEHCISFASGFWGLVLAMQALALPGREEVVMPSLTYRRLADVANWAGLTPHFCEVDGDTLAATPGTIAGSVSDRTAIIVITQPIVNCCDSPSLEEFAASRGIPLLFDSVESVYETCKGVRVGSFGNAELFSLHASKMVNGFEGGYVTTNDPELARTLTLARGFGFFGQDSVELLGLNAKLNEVHAAMALSSLDDLDDQVQRNRARYRRYQGGLEGLAGIRLVEFDESERCGFKNIVVELTAEWPVSRARTVEVLNADGVLARAYYSPPLHLKNAPYRVVFHDLATTERLAERFMVLPSGHHVSEDDIVDVIALLRFISERAAAINEPQLTGLR